MKIEDSVPEIVPHAVFFISDVHARIKQKALKGNSKRISNKYT
jgi:hypothetical protein